MIKVVIELSELDYEALLEKYFPMAGEIVSKKNKFLGFLAGTRVANWAATTYVKRSSQESLESKTMSVLNGQEDKLKSVLESKLNELDIKAKVKAFHFVVEPDSDDTTDAEPVYEVAEEDVSVDANEDASATTLKAPSAE